MANIYVTHLHLTAAANAALLAYRSTVSRDTGWAPIDVKDMQDNLIQALAGCEAGAGVDLCRETLLAVIEDAITDSFDLDWTAKDGARSVLNALLDNIAPMPAKAREAA